MADDDSWLEAPPLVHKLRQDFLHLDLARLLVCFDAVGGRSRKKAAAVVSQMLSAGADTAAPINDWYQQAYAVTEELGLSIPISQRPSVSRYMPPPPNKPPHQSAKFEYAHQARYGTVAPNTERFEMSASEARQLEELMARATARRCSSVADCVGQTEQLQYGECAMAQLEELGMERPMQLIIDTDIGSDFDDAMALLMLLQLPPEQFELIGITTCYHPTKLRKALADSMLAAAGWGQVPVVAGSDYVCGTHRGIFLPGNEGEGLDMSEQDKQGLWQMEESNAAADFLYSAVKERPDRVVIVAIGAMTNLGACAAEHSDWAQDVGHVFMMGGGSPVISRRFTHQWQQAPPFQAPVDKQEAAEWMLGNSSECKPVLLLPNQNVAADTLATCLLMRSGCKLSMIPNAVTSLHTVGDIATEHGSDVEWSGPAAPSSLRLGQQHERGELVEGCLLWQLSGRFWREWLRVRPVGALLQAPHDPLTLYEALYPSHNPTDELVIGKSCLRYAQGTFICHEWAGFITFVPDPCGPHRVACEALNPQVWCKWLDQTLVSGMPAQLRDQLASEFEPGELREQQILWRKEHYRGDIRIK